jgi:endonuclease/exonuclease/phosphatase (EEP) superfamily protein YafD
VALAVLTFMLNAFLIGRLAWHPEVSAADVAGDFRLRVLSLNVLMSNPDTQAVLDYVQASDADVVVLIEVNQQWITAMAPLATKYPHHIEYPRADNFGVALFSRIPWTKAGMLTFGAGDPPSIEVRMTHQGHDFAVIGTHPPPPQGHHYATVRDTKLRLLAEHVAAMNVPVLVVGDLNATPWSAGMRIATGGNMGFRSLSPPWTPTWSARSIFAIPIDHALATAPLIITARSVGADVGSDHRPLNLAVGWGR